ncbi:MAG TPA: hypothetical protein PLP11_01645 [Bacteroidales bacterium]|nr:hypothetical protein [Bacteroidales bacterium]
MKPVTLIIIFFMLSGSIFAQNTEFKVYFSAGNVYLKNKGTSSYITSDTPLAENSVICIPRDAYVVLINKAEMPMVISEEGEYNIPKITNLYLTLKESNLTEEFFNYIVDQMIESEHKRYVGAGVYKCLSDPESNTGTRNKRKQRWNPELEQQDLEYYVKKPDPGVFIMDTIINFQWAQSYGEYLKIVDASNDSLIRVIGVGDGRHEICLPISICHMVRGKSYRWSVERYDGAVKHKELLYDLKLAGDEDIFEFSSRLNEIENSTSNEEMIKLAKIRLYIDYKVYPMPTYDDL